MREYLFRGWNEACNAWIEGLLHIARYSSNLQIQASNKNCYSVIPETVGQYTGLTDKNGKKIFEHDIIETKTGEKFLIGYNEHFGGFVAYESAMRLSWEFIDEIGKVEVIGNIHDNPELLKGGVE